MTNKFYLLAIFLFLSEMPGVFAQMVYKGSSVLSTSIPVGRGESDERVIAVNVVTEGSGNPLELNAIKLNLTGTTSLADLGSLKIYYTAGTPRLSTIQLFGSSAVMSGTITVNGSQALNEGSNHFWITADLSVDAHEGNFLKGEIDSITLSGQEFSVIPGTTDENRLIILEHKLLFSGGDYGSVNFWIPAVKTADDGSVVVAVDAWGTPYYQYDLTDPFVNGDFIRYTSMLDGYDKSRLLFSIAAHPTIRKNLTVFLSYDEGATWGLSKVLNPGLTGYSCLTILSDGTIGCFYENGEYEQYQLYFARISLDWLSDGNDTFTFPVGNNTAN